MTRQKNLNADDERALWDAVRPADCFCYADIARKTGWSDCKAKKSLGIIRRMAREGRAKWTIPHLAQGRDAVPYMVVDAVGGAPSEDRRRRAILVGEVQSLEGVRTAALNGATVFEFWGQATLVAKSTREACRDQATAMRGVAATSNRVIADLRAQLVAK